VELNPQKRLTVVVSKVPCSADDPTSLFSVTAVTFDECWTVVTALSPMFHTSVHSHLYRVIQKEVYTFKNVFFKITDAKSMSCVRIERKSLNVMI
jgi:hypothetical protein